MLDESEDWHKNIYQKSSLASLFYFGASKSTNSSVLEIPNLLELVFLIHDP